jgi:hypothetical protein
MSKMSVPSAVAVSAVFLIASILVSVAVFGGVPVGPITPDEAPMVEAWIAWEGLDPRGVDLLELHEYSTMKFESYDERLDFIRSNNRDRPWLNIPSHWLKKLSPNETLQLEEWIESNELNRYADPKDTMYTGGSPLYNEMSGEVMIIDEYILNSHPHRPWVWADIVPIATQKEGAND